jgi:catechol 2,3-dioxygenase-like lactoylglutathione lyase family enzyme
MSDVGLTHIALQVTEMERALDFYAKYASMRTVHDRVSAETGARVVWISDHTRPFVVVLIESGVIDAVLHPFAHLGIGCASREEVDRLCEAARAEGILIDGPTDSGYPVGYWAFISDPDGHTLEVAFGQEVGLAVERADAD